MSAMSGISTCADRISGLKKGRISWDIVSSSTDGRNKLNRLFRFETKADPIAPEHIETSLSP